MAESWKSSIQNIPQTGRKQIYLQHILYFSVPQTFLLTFGGLTLDFLMLRVGNIKTNQEIQKKNSISVFFYYWEVLPIFVMWFA